MKSIFDLKKIIQLKKWEKVPPWCPLWCGVWVSPSVTQYLTMIILFDRFFVMSPVEIDHTLDVCNYNSKNLPGELKNILKRVKRNQLNSRSIYTFNLDQSLRRRNNTVRLQWQIKLFSERWLTGSCSLWGDWGGISISQCNYNDVTKTVI